MQLRRSKFEIILCVLDAVKNGNDKPTRIMHKTNLSWQPLGKVLESLVEQGLLEELENTGSRRSRKTYVLTEKGRGILSYFEGGSDLIDVRKILT